MKPCLTLTILSLLLGGYTAVAQLKDTIYLNRHWRDTTADQASYYRIRTRQGAGWQVSDYFRNGNTQMTGVYSDDSCKVRQGEFVWFDSTGLASHKCSFRDGKEDGKETFNWPGGKIWMTGSYKNGRREGQWLGYYASGQLAGDVMYEDDKQVSGTFYNADGSKNRKIKEFIRESEYPGGAAQWARFLNKTFRYPDKAVKNNIQGTVIVQFIVDEEGNPVNIEVSRSVHPLLDAEAVRVIAQSKNWEPAIYGGMLVKSYKKQPITFRF